MQYPKFIKMKSIILFVLFVIPISVSAQEDNLHWLTDFDAAKKISKNTKKPILMYFTGSDWCAPCIMLKEDFFSTTEFKSEAEKLILLKVDIPRRTDIISEKQLKANKKLLTTYNKQGGFPNIIALDNTGKVLGTEGSYSASLRDPKRYFNFVRTIIDNY